MIKINLLPPEIKDKIKKSKQTANVFSICLIAVIILVVSTFLLSAYKDRYLKLQLDNANSQLTSTNTSLTNFTDLQKKAIFLYDRGQLATQIESTRPAWAQILQSMINSVPTDVQFISLTSNITKSPNFVLEGSTVSDPEAIKFKDKLATSPFFKDVAFKSSTANTTQGATSSTTTVPATGIHFTLEFNLAKFSTQGAK